MVFSSLLYTSTTAHGYAGLYSTSEELRAVSVPSEAGPLTRSHQTKASREIKAKATSMSLLDPTYVIEVLPPWSGLRTRNVVALGEFSCRSMRSGEERRHMVQTG